MILKCKVLQSSPPSFQKLRHALRQVVKIASVGIGTRTCLSSQFKLISNNTYKLITNIIIYLTYINSVVLLKLSSSGFLLRWFLHSLLLLSLCLVSDDSWNQDSCSFWVCGHPTNYTWLEICFAVSYGSMVQKSMQVIKTDSLYLVVIHKPHLYCMLRCVFNKDYMLLCCLYNPQMFVTHFSYFY